MKLEVTQRIEELKETAKDLSQRIEVESSKYSKAKMTTQLRFAYELINLNEGILRNLNSKAVK